MGATRRGFLKMVSALAATAGKVDTALAAKALPQQVSVRPQRSTMSAAGWAGGRSVVNRKNLVGIQVKPFAWRDEGIDQLLDILQEKGAVNTIFANTYDTDPNRLQSNSKRKLPGHGKYGDRGKTRLGGRTSTTIRSILQTLSSKNFACPPAITGM